MKFRYVDDKYGNAVEDRGYTKEEFEEACEEAFGEAPELNWQTDGDDEWFVDEHGDVVLTTDKHR